MASSSSPSSSPSSSSSPFLTSSTPPLPHQQQQQQQQQPLSVSITIPPAGDHHPQAPPRSASRFDAGGSPRPVSPLSPLTPSSPALLSPGGAAAATTPTPPPRRASALPADAAARLSALLAGAPSPAPSSPGAAPLSSLAHLTDASPRPSDVTAAAGSPLPSLPGATLLAPAAFTQVNGGDSEDDDEDEIQDTVPAIVPSSSFKGSVNDGGVGDGAAPGHVSAAVASAAAQKRKKVHRRSKAFRRQVFAWDDVSYSLAGTRKKGSWFGSSSSSSKTVEPGRQLLRNVSGSVSSGEMIAIMGSSGAGKTTLLNCLSGRLTTGILSGSITHNGQPRDAHTWKKVMAYVEQDDALFSELTVRETIDFAAQLRLPAALTREEKSKHGDGLVKVLRLAGAANTKIGGGQSNARGVSGGERKRTAIAQELVGGPEILFLDEPTSGLDSNSSLSVLETVKHDAESTGRIVIATIHQPSWELLCLFDKVLLLAGGSTVYYGPPEAAITHFSGVGFTCKATQNPADYFLDLLTIDPSKSPESMEEDQKRVKMLQEYAKASSMPGDIEADGAAAPGALTRQNTFASSVHNLDAVKRTRSTRVSTRSSSFGGDSTKPGLRSNNSFPSGGGVGGAEVQRTLTRRSTIPHLYINDNSAGGSSNPWLFELRMTLGRSFQQFFRNRLVMALFFVRAVFLTVLVSFSFYRMEAWRDTATAQTLTDLSGFLYFWPVMLTYMTVLPIAGVFPMEREIIKRERAAGAYRTSSYFFGRCIVEIVVHSLFGILFMTTVAYFVVGLRTDGGGARFFAFLLIQWVGLVGSVGIGLVIGAAAKTVEMGQVVGPVAVITSLLYGGGLLNSADLIYPLKAFEWISPASYVYRASMQNELRGLVYASCNATSASVATAASIQCFRTGEDALAYYAVDDLSFWTCIGVGFALACAYMVLGYAILRTYGRAKTKII